MPVSVKRNPFNRSQPTGEVDPFSGCVIDPDDVSLRIPQARVLAVVMPKNPSAPIFDWPLITRAQLGARAGCTPSSGTITRALDGIRKGWTHGSKPHPGLLARGLVEEVVLDIEGVREVNYRATERGVRAYQAYIDGGGKLPDLKEASSCVNHRYKSS